MFNEGELNNREGLPLCRWKATPSLYHDYDSFLANPALLLSLDTGFHCGSARFPGCSGFN